MSGTPVYLEIGSKRVLAGALEWPGRCRSGHGDDGGPGTPAAPGPRSAGASLIGPARSATPGRQSAGASLSGDAEAVSELRRAVLEVLARPWRGAPVVERGWPPRYAARRFAWHVLDHAWEIEDRRDLTPPGAPTGTPSEPPTGTPSGPPSRSGGRTSAPAPRRSSSP